MSSGILLESALRGDEPPVERLADATIVVQADPSLDSGGQADLNVPLPERTRLDAGLADRLAAVRGVARAVPDRSFDVRPELPSGHSIRGMDDGVTAAHGWSSAALTPYRLVEGRGPEAADEIFLGSQESSRPAVHMGDRVRVAAGESLRVYTVVGIATTGSVTDPVFFFRDDVAAALSGTGDRADLIGILTDDDASATSVADRVAEVLPDGLRVLTGDERGAAESPGEAVSKEDTIAGLTVFGTLAAFISVFVVSSAFAMSVQQRHRELALLRAIGGTARQVRRMVAAEALLLAVLATLVAAPVSVLFAALERWLFVRAGLLSPGIDLTISWLPFAVGFLGAVVTTRLAAMASARRASRIHPTEALREAAVPPRRLSWFRLLGGLALAAAGAWMLARAALTMDSGGADLAGLVTFVWMLSAAMLGPALARPASAVLGVPVALLGRAPGRLAVVNLRTHLRRVASVATPVMLTVALGGTILIAKTTMQQQAADERAASTRADIVLRTTDGSAVPRDVARAAAGLDDVETSSGTLATSVVAGGDDADLHVLPGVAVDPTTIGRVLDLDVTRGSLAGLRGNTVAVRAGSDPDLGEVGDRVEVNLGDGTPVKLRIAATYARGLGFADVMLPRELVRGHTTQPLDDTVLLRLRQGADPDAVADRLDELVTPGQHVQVLTRTEYLDHLASEAAARNLEVYLLLGIIVLFCGLATVNGLGTAISQRSADFARLRLLGASPRQVIRMVWTESVVIVLFGTAVGALIAAPTLAVLSYSLTGDVVPWAPAWLYAGAGSALLLIGLTAGILPTRRALKLDPAKVIGSAS
jgi:putative ABC transport system permease protein